MALVYCVAAAKAELKRTRPGRRESHQRRVREKPSLGLVPVVDGKCMFCGRDIKTVS